MNRNEIIAQLKENVNKLFAPKTEPVVETELADIPATPAPDAKPADSVNADLQNQINDLQAQIDEILQMLQSITMGAEKPAAQEKLAKQYEDLKKSFEEFAKAPASNGIEVSKPEIKTEQSSKEEKLARIKELAKQPYIQELARNL